MSTTDPRVAVAARRAAAQALPPEIGFNARWRQVAIIARDPATLTASVQLGGDTSIQHDGVPCMPPYVPRVGDKAWLIQNGTDLILISALDAKAPGCRLWKNATAATSSSVNSQVSFGVGTEIYDTDGMHDESTNTTRITCNWPGRYSIGLNAAWVDNATGRRIAEVLLNGTTVILSSRFVAQTSTDTNVHTADADYLLAVGDYIELQVFQSSGGPLSVNNFANWSPVLWADWLGYA